MEANPTRRSAPRPWLAVIVSVLLPGLGHAYAGRFLRGLAVAASINVALRPLLAALALVSALAMWPGALIAAVLVLFFVPFDAYVASRSIAQAFRSASGEMPPTLLIGDLSR